MAYVDIQPQYLNSEKKWITAFDMHLCFAGTMSSSSGALSRISIALDVVSTLLAYTSSFDHIAIVPFGSEPKTLVSNELIRATTPNMHTLLDAGRATALNCSGKSNLAAAFEKAFEVLRNSMNGYKTSDCQRVRKALCALSWGEVAVCLER